MGRGVEHTPPFSAEVKQRVELYLLEGEHSIIRGKDILDMSRGSVDVMSLQSKNKMFPCLHSH